MDDVKTLSYAEAAKRIGMSESWLRKAKKARKVPYTGYGRSVRFSEANIEQIIAQHNVPVRVSTGQARRQRVGL
jgi:excisionase family DNA binding protein